MRIAVRTKIIGLTLGLMTFVILVLSSIFAFIEAAEIEETIGDKALSTAVLVAQTPLVVQAFEQDDPSATLQPFAERVRKQTGADFVVIGNSESIRYSHPEERKIGKKMVGGDNDRALVDGESYISKATGSLGPSLRGKSPILDDDGEIIGIVSVGFMIEDIRSLLFKKLGAIGLFALVALALGFVGSIFLAKSIKRDMYDLEPYQIAALYRERMAILQAIREGIVALDKNNRVTMLNDSARQMLGIVGDIEGKPINEVLPDAEMTSVLTSGKTEHNEEFYHNGLVFIVNCQPIVENGSIEGIVASFRDKTEMIQMANTLSDIKRYSDDLRAQNHEFTNKLYVLSGYLQLGHYDKAIDLIQQEAGIHEKGSRMLFTHIHDPTVQAILVGKMAKASEKKIHFTIDENSSLDPLPPHIGQAQLISVLGNVIDNAIDAVIQSAKQEVRFFATDIGHDIVFEVIDSGPGVPDNVELLFRKGYTNKSTGQNERGFGLAIVKQAVEEMGGMIEVVNRSNGGAVFTIFLPKKYAREESGIS